MVGKKFGNRPISGDNDLSYQANDIVNIRNSFKPAGRITVAAFTLIEMIGVLSIIVILAGLLLPKVASVIYDAKIDGTAASYESIQAAVDAHYGKYLVYNALFGTNLLTVPITSYDTSILLPEGYLDHPFTSKIGSGRAICQLVTGAAADSGQGYYFAGASNGVASTASMQYVVECVLTNVSIQDAYYLSLAVDGPTLTPALDGLADTAGRITYNPTLNSGTLRMYVDGR